MSTTPAQLACPGALLIPLSGRCKTRNVYVPETHPSASKTWPSTGAVPTGFCRCNTTHAPVLPVLWSHVVTITRAIKQKMPVCTVVPQAETAQMCSLTEFIQARGRGWITSENGNRQKVINWRTNHRKLFTSWEINEPHELIGCKAN